jgi:hypothetical protein
MKNQSTAYTYISYVNDFSDINNVIIYPYVKIAA